MKLQALKVPTFRQLLIGALGLGQLGLFIWTAFRMSQTLTGMEKRLMGGDVDAIVIQKFFDKMTTIVQFSVGLMGAAWSLLILKDTNVELRGASTFAFVILSISFAIAILFYSYGYDLIVSRLFFHRVFDLGAPIIQFVSGMEQMYFLFGCVAFVATILLGRKAS